MSADVSLVAIARTEGEEFQQMALQYFKELNPQFVPAEDWKETYFDNIQQNPNYWLRWIIYDNKRSGFILFGIESHLFLPRKTGVIRELFVAPEERRKNIARKCAQLAIAELAKFSPTKIQLEIVEGNKAAAEFWKSLGFKKTSECFSMRLESGSPNEDIQMKIAK